MTLQKLIVPVLLITSLLLAACGGTEPAASEAPVAEATATAVEVAATAATTDTTTADPASIETAGTEGEAASYVVDVATSRVTWYGSKPIGASETGTVNITEGQMNFAGEQLVDGMIVIDMTSIATTSQSGGMADQLVGHLSSDDFFGVATYPTAQLVLKSVEATETANQYLVKADLTIKETTKEIEFVTDVAVADDTLNGSAEIIVNRADFDVRYNSAAFFSGLGDDLISDEMTITVALVAQKS
jgi:polyisoprenoid-binding protein YceI